jgi:hypothetical protein
MILTQRLKYQNNIKLFLVVVPSYRGINHKSIIKGTWLNALHDEGSPFFKAKDLAVNSANFEVINVSALDISHRPYEFIFIGKCSKVFVGGLHSIEEGLP